MRANRESQKTPELTVIMVSYNTRDLTLRAVETLLENAGEVVMEVIVWDNASRDGSAEAIAERFPQVQLVAYEENIGFAAANNRAAQRARGELLLLLNPDTETHPKAIERLHSFAKQYTAAGIVGGKTLYPDGSLNPTSCWNRITIWSLFCAATALSRLFPGSCLFNPEAIGCWRRDSERNVDIVTGCFLMVRRVLWDKLGGFDERYFMYGEDADLCLRAGRLGYKPRITPEAQIMHMVGASTTLHQHKIAAVMKARATLVRQHWPASLAPIGLGLLWLWAANRLLGARLRTLNGKGHDRLDAFRHVWARRRDWLAGY